MDCLELIGLTTSSTLHRMEPDAHLDLGKVLLLANCLSHQTARSARRDSKRSVKQKRPSGRGGLLQKPQSKEGSKQRRHVKLKKLASPTKNGPKGKSKNGSKSR